LQWKAVCCAVLPTIKGKFFIHKRTEKCSIKAGWRLLKCKFPQNIIGEQTIIGELTKTFFLGFLGFKKFSKTLFLGFMGFKKVIITSIFINRMVIFVN